MKKPRFTTLYIVRHGETVWNVKKLLQGHADSRLTKKGEIQARLVKDLLKDVRFDAVFSSDLTRSRKTAEIIALERKLAVQTTKLIRERSFGEYEGKHYTVFAQELKHLLAKFEKLTDSQKYKFKYTQSMESDAELVGRFITFLREIAVAYSGKTLLVVSHGGMMRALLIHLGYGNYRSLYPGVVKNTSYFVLETDGVEFKVTQTFNIEKAIILSADFVKNHHGKLKYFSALAPEPVKIS